MATFAYRSPKPLWARLNPNEDLVFLSYKHLVTRLRGQKAYRLLDPSTGEPIKRMGADYFNLMFARTDTGSSAFKRANWRGTPPDQAYEKSAHFLEPRVTWIDTTVGHTPAPFEEGASLKDPYNLKGYTANVLNRWDHFHFQGSANEFPSCRLTGGARLSCEETPGTER